MSLTRETASRANYTSHRKVSNTTYSISVSQVKGEVLASSRSLSRGAVLYLFQLVVMFLRRPSLRLHGGMYSTASTAKCELTFFLRKSLPGAATWWRSSSTAHGSNCPRYQPACMRVLIGENAVMDAALWNI